MFLEAPASAISEVYLSESFALKNVGCGDIADRLKHVAHETVSDDVFRKMSDTKTPQGILCVVRQIQVTLSELLEKSQDKSPFFIILEDIQDPGNLGTILRTGEGAGVDGVILSSGTVDIYNPKTIRSTMGSLFRVPVIYEKDLGAAMDRLKAGDIRIYAADPDAAHPEGGKDYDCCDYTRGTAFLIGNEGNGLSEKAAGQADIKIRIPMKGQVESLNAAVAAAVLLYEAYRQRRK